MRVIVAGPRDLLLKESAVGRALFVSGFDVDEIVEGGANGVDCAASRYAEQAGIPRRTFCPDWKEHGKAAGPIRNRQMAEYADALVAIKQADRETAGTRSMIRVARDSGLLVHVYNVRDGDVYG